MASFPIFDFWIFFAAIFHLSLFLRLITQLPISSFRCWCTQNGNWSHTHTHKQNAHQKRPWLRWTLLRAFGFDFIRSKIIFGDDSKMICESGIFTKGQLNNRKKVLFFFREHQTIARPNFSIYCVFVSLGCCWMICDWIQNAIEYVNCIVFYRRIATLLVPLHSTMNLNYIIFHLWLHCLHACIACASRASIECHTVEVKYQS